MMKNLTHYFTSPKENKNETKSSSILIANSGNSDAPTHNDGIKKRKLGLSKSKPKKNENIVDVSENDNKIKNENKIQDKSNKKNKKRKIAEDKVCAENNVNSKKIKLSKSKSIKLQTDDNSSSSKTNRDTQENAGNQLNCQKNIEVISVENHSNSSDEPLAKTKKSKLKKNVLLESDDDTTSSLMIQENTGKQLNCKKNVKVISVESTKNCSDEPLVKTKKSKLQKHFLLESDDNTTFSLMIQENTGKQLNCKKNVEVISVESNRNSSDEPLAKTKKSKLKKHFLLESDDKISSLAIVSRNSVKKSSETSEPSKNCMESTLVTVKDSNGARNSLLGYFNKVDKETALKEKKPELIKVEVQVHLPPAEKDKTPRCSLNKIPKKLKTPKNKQVNDYDYIEVISSENISEESKSDSVQIYPQVQCKEVNTNDIKAQINTVNAKPANIASIFISKKAEKSYNKSSTDISLKNENVAMKEEDLKKDNAKPDRHTKQKKSLRIKSAVKKASKNDENIKNSKSIKLLNESPEVLDSKKSNQEHKQALKIVHKRKSKLTKTVNNQNGFENQGSQSQNICDKIHSSQNQILDEKTEEAYLTVNQASVNKTPEKLKVHQTTDNSKNKMRTPLEKSHTLNGYFTPKANNDSCEKIESADKACKQLKSPSAWVMKVRLSATKAAIAPGSDEEVEEETQEGKIPVSQKIESDVGRKEIKSSSSKVEEDDNSVVVVDEEGSSDSFQENRTKRKSLSRSAKSLKYVPEEKPEATKPSVKMWPFFQKGGARQVKEPPVDQDKLKAKLMFLESGVPDVLKKKVEIEKSESVAGVPAPFPTVTHVTQLEVVSAEVKPTNFLYPRQLCHSPPPSVPPWTYLLSIEDSDEVEIPVFQRPESVKSCLEKMKDEELKTEVKTLYKCLKEYKSKAESDIWTEVYKPIKSADIVGNSENIKKLKTWLETFKNRRRREGSVSSGDEFINEDSDGETTSINNLAVISGPYGCGKTCAVYAIAAELDCKVLEMNASCNRSGKRILAEFSESTQSHQVERSQKLNEMFNNQSSRKPKKKKKLKKTEEAKSEKTSLILVEDADLLYTDADEGYMQALSSLAATAKRPIILLTNQTRNPHLDRFQSNRPLHLTFSKPKSSKLELWLRLIGLVEGVEVTADQAKCLVAWSGCDVRRALLQFQLMVHSNNSELKGKLSHSELWWQWPLYRELQYELPTLLEAEEPPLHPPQKDKVQLLRELRAISKTTSRLAYLDSFSARCSLQMLDKEENPCPTSWMAQCSDSTAQAQCLLDPVHSTSIQLADWLADTVAREGNNIMSTERPGGQTAQEARWLSILRQSEQMFLSGVSSTMLSNHKAVACEYLPTLREIGRSEQVRLTNYSRRANRFFNYLQGLGIHASKSYRDFMCDAFS